MDPHMTSKAKNNDNSVRVERGADAQEQGGSLGSTREDRIKHRAYEIYKARGEEPGHDLEDWLQAERELATDQTKADSE